MLTHLALFAALLPAAVTAAVAAPTDVTLAWASDAHQSVQLTWREDGDYADHVWVTDLDGTAIGYDQKVAAGQPDRLVISTADLPRNVDVRLAIQPVDATGQPLGDAAHSVGFDTDQTPRPVVTDATPRVDGTILLTWKAGAYHDDTPGDPLDLPDAPARYVPLGSQPTFNDFDQLVTAPIAGTSFVVPTTRTLPEWLGVLATPNEWGASRFPGNIARITRTQLTASIPHTAVTGQPLRVTGVSTLIVRICDPGPCGSEPDPDSGRVLHLQARTSGTAPWQTVATTTAAARDGKYSFRITSPGTRQYRVVAEPISGVDDQTAKSYAVTAAVTVASSSSEGGSGGGLPITGAPVAWIAAGGAVLLLLGIGLAVAGRRRKRVET